ncbi:MAG TPA: tRNA lysidine(34) synthetase TilS [Solirubrobacteraceae bacterium]|nr:tRNA lysidine(34) synthetase TilS [Solirubrobacteraceae bacterium]
MAEVLGEVSEALARAGLRAGAPPLVVMISGGRDSVCLLDALARSGCAARMHALHVNYGLRGSECEEDERLCVELCAQRAVPITVACAPQAPARGNLQAWARECRYREAAALAEALGEGALIVTAHTASDQVETILYRLAASPGRRALLGMPAREGTLVRPLLSLTREQTTAYCRARGLRWREDPSNAADRFARSRARQALLPAFRSLHPAAERNLLRSAALLRAESEVLEQLVEQELGGGETIAIERLRALPRPLARLVLIELAERVTGGFVPQAGERLDELIALGERRRSGAPRRRQLHLGGGAGAVIEEGTLRMVALRRRRGGRVDCGLVVGGSDAEQGSV